jgi:hypothetical protein
MHFDHLVVDEYPEQMSAHFFGASGAAIGAAAMTGAGIGATAAGRVNVNAAAMTDNGMLSARSMSHTPKKNACLDSRISNARTQQVR